MREHSVAQLELLLTAHRHEEAARDLRLLNLLRAANASTEPMIKNGDSLYRELREALRKQLP